MRKKDYRLWHKLKTTKMKSSSVPPKTVAIAATKQNFKPKEIFYDFSWLSTGYFANIDSLLQNINLSFCIGKKFEFLEIYYLYACG